MRVTFVGIMVFVVTAVAPGQQVQDVSQLVGKRVIVQRMPLCEPGTYNQVIAYAGKQATVISAKPSNMIPSLSQSVLARIPAEGRALLEDQQKAATVLVQLADGKKLDTCAPVGPARILQYFELAEGETLSPPPQSNAAPPPSKASPQSEPGEMLSEAELKSALAGSGKDHSVEMWDEGWKARGGARQPRITLAMSDFVIWAKAEQAKKQFLPYTPSEEDRKRFLSVYSEGFVGETYQEGCQSITRIVLLSSPSGSTVEEAYSSESGTEAFGNAFGATVNCQWLRARFSLAAVRRVQTAAQDGEFYVAVFAGTQNTKTYKIKHKHQAKLQLD